MKAINILIPILFLLVTNLAITFGQDTSLSFGSTAGALNVSPTGAASYSMPINCPHGIGGMVPQVSVAYNSQTGNGIAGFGVNITGSSVISRINQDFFHDAFSRQLSLDKDDRFVLDGNRLICTSGAYGNDNSEYHTESETFSLIKAVGNYNSTGPESFEVQAKNGTKFLYGSATGKLVYTNGLTDALVGWYLDYQEDIYGNYMSYTYEQIGLSLYLKTITYGSNKTTGGVTSTVEFTYESRPDPVPVVICNLKAPMSSRLSKIVAKTGSSVYRQYDLDYTTDIYSRLLKITESNGSGETLNPTGFTWKTVEQTPAKVSEFTWDSFRDNAYVTADFNGDGITDIGEIKRGADGDFMDIYAARPSTNGNISFFEAGSWSFGGVLSYTDSDGKLLCESNLAFPDIDGDGKAECAVVYKEGNYFKFKFLKGGTVASTPFYNLATQKELLLATFDMYHDGYEDLLYLERDQRDDCYNGRVFRFKENYSYFAVPYVVRDIENPQHLFVADMDRDGLEDLVIAAKNNIYIFGNSENSFSETPTRTIPTNVENYRLFKLGDFNGDGLVDFIYLKENSGTWTLALNNGNSGFTLTNLPAITMMDDPTSVGDNAKDNIIVMDFNNDGKSDIITFDAKYALYIFTGFTTSWYKSTGDNFELVSSSNSTNPGNAFKNLYLSGDFNGDGRVDLLNYGYNCLDGTSTDKLRVYSTFNTGGEGLISGITNGLGNTNQLLYKSSSNITLDSYADQYELLYETYAFPLRYFGASFPVVKSITTAQGVADNTTVDYSFLKPAGHYLKGFLGFGQTTTTSSLTGETAENNFSFDYLKGTSHYYLPYASTSSVKMGTKLLSESDYWSDLFTYTGNGYYFYQDYKHTRDYMAKNETYSEYMNNSDGNPTGTSESIYDLNDDNYYIKSVVYNQYEDRISSDANTTPNAPGEIVTSTYYDDGSGEPFVAKTTLNYNTDGSISSKTDFANKTIPVVTSYTYWPTGNINITTVSATGMDSRSDTTVYESSGRFVSKVANALGHTTESDYNTWGLPNWNKDENGLYTYYSYDNWGQLTTTTLPDKNEKISAVDWATDDDAPTGALYCSRSYIDNELVTGKKFTGASYFDAVGHKLRDVSIDNNGDKFYSNISYNTLGQVTEITEPYPAGGSSSLVTTFTYDSYFRKATETSTLGTVTTYDYHDDDAGIILETTLSTGETYKKTYNPAGLMVESIDPGGTLSYSYNAAGQTTLIQSPGGKVETTYNEYGRKETLSDPDAGVTSYTYNGFGELWQQTDAIGKQTELGYDKLGRVTSKTINGITTTYSFDSYNDNQWLGSLLNVSDGNGSHTFSYDAVGRLSTEERANGSESLTFQYGYDTKSRLSQLTYPGGFSITNSYNDYNNLTEVRNYDGDGLIWSLDALNDKGLISQITYGNNIQTQFSYDTYNRPSRIFADGAIDFNYQFNEKHQLDYRIEKYDVDGTWQGFEESFGYDGTNRLYTVKNNGSETLRMTYLSGSNDRIGTKSDIGTYEYANLQNHKVTGLPGSTGYYQPRHDITYTASGKLATLTETGIGVPVKELTIEYGVDDERFMQTYSEGGSVAYNRYYFDNYEKETDADGNLKRDLNYIYAGGSLVAIYEQTPTDGKMHYVHTDYLGSLRCITDADGNVEQLLGYDAWGNRREPIAGARYVTPPTDLMFARGFTGHEHMDEFGLINMNARVYDPALGVFLSPDNYVSDPTSSQAFNRYCYGLNNPMSYVDPDGNCPLLLGLAIYAFGNAIMKGVYDANTTGGDFNWNTFWNSSGTSLGYSALGFGFGALGNYLAPTLGITSQIGQSLFAAGMGYLGSGATSYIMSGKWDNMSAIQSGVMAGLSAWGHYKSPVEIRNEMRNRGAIGEAFDKNLIHRQQSKATAPLYRVGNFDVIFQGTDCYLGPDNYSSYNADGVTLDLGYNSNKYSKYNWVQTVNSNYPSTEKTYPLLDHGAGTRFYNEPGEGQEGYVVGFHDSPHRPDKGVNYYWKAELTLIGNDGKSWYPISTLNWGYSVNNGIVTNYPVTIARYNSYFHNYQLYYSIFRNGAL